MKKYYLIFITIFLLPIFVNATELDSLKVVSPKSVSVGEKFTISVLVGSPTQPMNAVSGTLIYPNNVSILNIDKGESIINFWTKEPTGSDGQIKFEGVVLNPGYQGLNGNIFKIDFIAKKEGDVNIYFSNGAVLANDGLGTNIVGVLGKSNVSIKSSEKNISNNIKFIDSNASNLPVITEYSPVLESKDSAYVKGFGEPNAITKIVFEDTSIKSIGERFISILQTKKRKLDSVLIRNSKEGAFEYITPSNLIAGAYNATPFLVDNNNNSEKPGFGVQILINDSKIVKQLVVLINVLALLIPIVGLCMAIYFIPWFSWRKIRVLGKRLGLEEERLNLSEKKLKIEEDNLK